MAIPKYLEAFRRAAREAQSNEKNVFNEKRGKSEGLNSLNTFISSPELPSFGRFGRTFSALEARCPTLVDVVRWQQCVEDGRAFLAKWGTQAEALGWTSADLFGLHTPPEKPHPSYNRLSRYDYSGLCWLLEGRSVTVLTETSALVENPATGTTTLFRKNHRPALGPLGDSLEDLK
jgi:hypothetical protein